MDIEVLDRIMDQIAQTHPAFGVRGLQDGSRRRRGENEFQRAMHGALIAERLADCRRELSFLSFRFINKEKLMLDIAASGFAIELKYVANGVSGRPADGQAFPYDVILDCARIEALIGKQSIANGVVIGLTNDARQWDPDTEPDWWSRRFRLPDVSPDKNGWTPLPLQLFEVTTTKKRRNIDGAIFVDERYHVRLDHQWEYRWRNFPAQWNGGTFRYVTVRKCSNIGVGHVPCEYDPLKTVPFADEASKLAALQHRLEMVKKLHTERSQPQRLGKRKSQKATQRLLGTLLTDILRLEQSLSQHSLPVAAE